MPCARLSSRSSLLLPISAMLPAGTMCKGSVTSSIWTPLSRFAATATYVWSPDVNVVMSCAPLSFRVLVSMLPAGVMCKGSVMLRIWTPSSRNAATAAYVWPPDTNVVMPYAPLSSRSSVLLPIFVMLPAGIMCKGSVTSSIWTPLSRYAATATYVWPPDSNVAMPDAPSSSRVSVSVMLPAAVMCKGSVMLRIWTPSSRCAATAAYVWPPDTNVTMPRAPLSSRSSVLVPISAVLPAAVMMEGFVILRIWTPSEEYAATAAYVWPPDSNVVMPRAPRSSRSAVSSPISMMLPAAVMLDGSVTFSI